MAQYSKDSLHNPQPTTHNAHRTLPAHNSSPPRSAACATSAVRIYTTNMRPNFGLSITPNTPSGAASYSTFSEGRNARGEFVGWPTCSRICRTGAGYVTAIALAPEIAPIPDSRLGPWNRASEKTQCFKSPTKALTESSAHKAA